MNYDKYSKESIISYGKKLENYSLLDLYSSSIIEHVSNSKKGKGDLGVLIEKFHFNYEPNSDPGPDFSEAELELKTSKLESYKDKKKGYRPKERLKLKSINYNEIFDKNFESTLLFKKIVDILFVYYEDDDRNKKAYEKKIKIVAHWNLPKEDIEIIKKDYETIVDKIDDGFAHELSDGDTYLLAASTSGNSKLKNQKNSSIKAKERSFTFKNHYNQFILKQILLREYSEKEWSEYSELLGKKVTHESIKEEQYTSIDSIIIKLKDSVGKSCKDILGVAEEFSEKDKSFYSRVTKSIIGDEQENIKIIQKTGVVIRSVRISENNSIDESVSFPAFKFFEIFNQEWEDSEFYERVNSKFIFVFYKKRNNGEYYLEKVREWHMPYKDREECRKVWLDTKDLISTGNIFKGYAMDKNTGKVRLSKKGNPIRYNNLPKPSHPICHVRPHAKDSNDTFPLPVEDKKLNVKEYTKQCFWIKNQYILENVFLE